ncbi:MAG: saccharopine dehydrogenase NADP-binding domain-containing protein [Xanthomonadales bacterium]|nr:saccharopine dehydrogenase NADP-binding domain-containing protein [Xanthomonadales bacterium]
MALRVLLIGAGGVFGSSIARRLAHDPRFALTLAGRRSAPLQALCKTLGDASVRFATLDTTAARLDDALGRLRAQLVIHTAGPFQAQDYRVAEACLACNSDYIDLADGREFVCGFAQLDQRARAAGRLLISGASSVPALSAAVVDALLPRFRTLECIEHAISPGNHTERGAATVAAILGYCGRPIRVWRDGRWQQARGWLDGKRQSFPCGRRRTGVCEVPDLSLFPLRYPDVRSVVFRAGLELPLLNVGLVCLASLVRFGVIHNLAAWAPALRRLSEYFKRWGTDRGGMVVELAGTGTDGAPLRLRWWLDAAAGVGPQVPTTAAVVLAQQLADGRLTAQGAMPCVGLLTLDQWLDGFAGCDLRTGVETLERA